MGITAIIMFFLALIILAADRFIFKTGWLSFASTALAILSAVLSVITGTELTTVAWGLLPFLLINLGGTK